MVVILSGAAQAWNRDRHHRNHRYDRHDHRYYHYRYDHRHRHSSPYYRNYRHPGYHRYHTPRYKNYYTMEDGWDLVKKDRSHTALDIFEDLAKSNPGAGGPKLGYAIAAADTDRLAKGVWAMRRALQFGPGAFQQFSPDRRLEGKLKRLVSKYEGRSHGLPEKDAYFMQASLYYLLKDTRACHRAIERNKGVDDYSDSAKNLYYMAEKYM